MHSSMNFLSRLIMICCNHNVEGAFTPETSLELGSFKSLTNSLGSQNKDLESRICSLGQVLTMVVTLKD